VFPNKQNVDLDTNNHFKSRRRKNKITTNSFPNAEDEGVWIHQDACL
jgi:hypothetical protein